MVMLVMGWAILGAVVELVLLGTSCPIKRREEIDLIWGNNSSRNALVYDNLHSSTANAT